MKSHPSIITAGAPTLFLLLTFSMPLLSETTGSTPKASSEKPVLMQEESQIISFSWRPKSGPDAAYRLDALEDQHKIIIFSKAAEQAAPSVVVGFHGQPSRGNDPRNYAFGRRVEDLVQKMIANKEIPPVILVLPVFRFVGQNWPSFDLVDFKEKVVSILREHHITPGEWFLFGHSGAAGCGGDGLNQAHRISPKAVGFFDTCLGRGWQTEIEALKTQKIQTLNIHSVETAGFRPKQSPEYQSGFDFGRAYGPLGIQPVTCPKMLPKAPLREQPYRCAATSDGKVEAFVVNTGEGADAHTNLLPEALWYFLVRFISQ